MFIYYGQINFSCINLFFPRTTGPLQLALYSSKTSCEKTPFKNEADPAMLWPKAVFPCKIQIIELNRISSGIIRSIDYGGAVIGGA